MYAIFIHTCILNFDPETPYIYPCFFLNIDELCVVDVVKRIGILSAIFIVIEYTIFGVDKISKKNNLFDKGRQERKEK